MSAKQLFNDLVSQKGQAGFEGKINYYKHGNKDSAIEVLSHDLGNGFSMLMTVEQCHLYKDGVQVTDKEVQSHYATFFPELSELTKAMEIVRKSGATVSKGRPAMVDGKATWVSDDEKPAKAKSEKEKKDRKPREYDFEKKPKAEVGAIWTNKAGDKLFKLLEKGLNDKGEKVKLFSAEVFDLKEKKQLDNMNIGNGEHRNYRDATPAEAGKWGK